VAGDDQGRLQDRRVILLPGILGLCFAARAVFFHSAWFRLSRTKADVGENGYTNIRFLSLISGQNGVK
jgi:hypothetical protein